MAWYSATPMSRPHKHAPVTPPANRPALWLLLAAISAAVYALLYFFPALFWYVGVQHYDIWFGDTYALLASGDAVTQGLNPYVPNPLDFFHRPHVYSHWWLAIRHLGLTRADISWLGPLVVIAAWLTALRVLRPRTTAQFWFSLAVLISSPVILAFERANNDLVIFLLLAPVVSCLMSSRGWIRSCAPVLIGVAAGLKYYPATAGLLLMFSRDRRRLVVMGIVILAFVAISVAQDLAIFGPLAPKPSGWLSFGASTLFTSFGVEGRLPAVLSLLGAALIFAWGWWSTRLSEWEASPEKSATALKFILSAVLLSGCFFTSVNFSYRWIFAAWLPPFLWELSSDQSVPSRARSLAKATSWLLVAVLWLDTVFTWVAIVIQGKVAPDSIRAWVRVSIMIEQPITWAFFACLLVFLARFTKHGIRALVSSPS